MIPDITFLRGGSPVAKLLICFVGHSENLDLLLTNTLAGRVLGETFCAGAGGIPSLLGLPCKLQKNTESSLGEPGILFREGGGPSRETLVVGGGPSSTLLGGNLDGGSGARLLLFLLLVERGRTGFIGEAGSGGGVGRGTGGEGGGQ